MAVVFWKEVCRQYQLQMASTELNRGPRRRVCQFALSNAKTRKSQTQFVAESLFLGSCDAVRLKYHQRQLSKNNNGDRLGNLMTRKPSSGPIVNHSTAPLETPKGSSERRRRRKPRLPADGGAAFLASGKFHIPAQCQG